MKEDSAAWLRLLEMRGYLCHGLSPRSIDNYGHALRVWAEYCGKIRLTVWQQCTVEVAIAYVAWVKKRVRADKTVLNLVHFPLRCVELLQQMEPGEVHPSFVIPYAQFPKQGAAYRGAVISEARLSEAMGICVRAMENTTCLSRSTIIPFIVLFCLRTGMNVDSVMQLPRDCTVTNEAGHWLYWQKNRSQGSMRDHYDAADWGAVEIIHALLRLHSNPHVFSYGVGRTKPLGRLAHDVRAWCRDNGIEEFTLKDIRPSKATLIYQESGGRVSEVQRFLHHSSLNTTILYLSENIIRPMHEKALAAGQEAMLERWGIPKEGEA